MDWVTQHNDSLTLRDLQDGGHTVAFQCKQCWKITPLDLDRLVVRHGGETRVSYVKRNTKCPNCR